MLPFHGVNTWKTSEEIHDSDEAGDKIECLIENDGLVRKKE